MKTPSLAELKQTYERFGIRDHGYLEFSYNRFVFTQQQALQSVSKPLDVLDLGAHWLFSSLFYAQNGHRVIGADLFSNPYEFEFISTLAHENGIRLVSYKDLSQPIELRVLPENSVDLVLFAEILEHITFNPVAMWTEVYRVLRPGGRIILTTPNYYYLMNLVKDARQVLSGNGAGPDSQHILEVLTYGHHWKLYSTKDIKKYFSILSPDFTVENIRYFFPGYPRSRIKAQILKTLTWWSPLKENIYCEIRLESKRSGIVIKPHW